MTPAADQPGAAGLRLFLCGDVMTGRGIDQVLPSPVPPQLFEPWVRSAMQYVELAEEQCGPIGRRLDVAYPWGDALAVLERMQPAARIVNLETAVTTSDAPQPGKGIHYRMHPANVSCLTAAAIDCCALANNHVLDWGEAGLLETVAVLEAAALRTAGAGRDAARAAAPAALPLPGGGRLLVFAVATADSGVPPAWRATAARPGVHLLDAADAASAARLSQAIRAQRGAGDLVVVSVHWGGNWGFAVPGAQREFAHALIEAGAADVVHGHSSHHVKPLDVWRGKLVLYGCGDFINDYEGIGGQEHYRPDLALMYFPRLDRASGRLAELRLVPLRRRALRLQHADRADLDWCAATLTREGRAFATAARVLDGGELVLEW